MGIQIGVIGTGGIGQQHIERIMTKMQGAKVVAVNDVNEELCGSVAKRWDLRVERDSHALISAADVDAVLVASWDPTHEEFCTAAIQAGKPVFCEKPLADTSQGCKRIMEAEIKSGKHLVFVGFMRRYDKGYNELREAVQTGRLGHPLILHCKHRNPHPFGATHTTDMSVTGSLVHEFDVIRYLIGEDDPYISAQLVCPRSSKYADENLMDPQLVYLETESGVRINIESFVNCRYGYDVQCEIVGEEGTASLPDLPHILTKQTGLYGYKIDDHFGPRFPEAYDLEMRDWLDSLAGGKSIGANAWDGYVTAAVAEACVEARKLRQVVPIQLGERPDFYKK